MNIRQILESQYLASLAMLKQAILRCPESVWDVPTDPFKFWSRSYHAIFFTHLYMEQAEKDFIPWEKHHDPDGDIPFTKDEVLEYLAFTEKRVRKLLYEMDLEAKSGFAWYPVDHLELQFINIRHIQQHTGELYEHLGIRENIELGWVGYQHTQKEHE